MKASIYHIQQYVGEQPTGWPVAAADYNDEAGGRSFDEATQQSLLADELGFDWVSFSEHHYMNVTLSPTPMLMAANLAPHLKHAKIAMLGPTMPLNNPAKVAEELSMLDNMTKGQLIVGLLRGTPNEYQTYFTNPAETRAKTLEGMELILKAWTEPYPFAWEGRFYQYRVISSWPTPYQKPYPPVYVLGTSSETADFAAEHHMGIGCSFDWPYLFRPNVDYYREACNRHGWDPAPEQIIYRGRVYVAETDEQAQEYVRVASEPIGGPSRRTNEAVSEAVGKVDPNNRSASAGYAAPERRPPAAFLGSPDTVVEQIKKCREEMGAGVVDLWFQNGLGHEKTMRSIELFGKEVLPRIRDL